MKPAELPAEIPAHESVPVEVEPLPPPASVPKPRPARNWRQELSQRVENFRRRRARLRQGFDATWNLDLGFEAAPPEGTETAVGARVIEFPQGQGEPDLEFGNPASPEAEGPILDAVSLEKPEGGARNLNWAAVEVGDFPLERRGPQADPVEIFLDSSPAVWPEPPAGDAILALPAAPLGRRFLAGVMDALVLLAAAGLFALIFWRAGGRISPDPVNFAVLAFLLVFFILVYFGLFTALTSSTPGQLSMGLEVRNLDGTFPSAQDSFWRAFGVLVSGSALMLGFIWALVDSDGLSWHDRMSGTFLTVAKTAKQL